MEKKKYKCDNCGREATIVEMIDIWAIVDNKYYCLKCQKDLKIGWYEKKDKCVK